jgi:ribonuclease D
MQTARNALATSRPLARESLLRLGDVSQEFFDAANRQLLIAWDIETSGLDWRSERIGLCQVWTAELGLELVKIDENRIPCRLVELLADARVQKIFHHAMFDLRFLYYRWAVVPANIGCTKIASKLLVPENSPDRHTLASLVREYLGVSLDKTQRISDWLKSDLSQEQMSYAGNDVIYLPDLFRTLMAKLEARGLDDLASRCFAHIPTQVQLDVRGYKDIFGY